MKTATALVTLLAAGALAQPHIHARHAHQQHHRALDRSTKCYTEWVTVWETKYVTVDGPASESTSTGEVEASPGNFMDQTQTADQAAKPEESSTSTPEHQNPAATTPTVVEEHKVTTNIPPPKETTPTTTYTPPQETTEEVEPEPTTTAGGGGSGGSGGSYSGFITYYSTGLGACGEDDSNNHGSGTFDNPMVVAVSKNIFFDPVGPNGNEMPDCGKKIVIESPDAPGVQAYGIIRDACEACTTIGDIDVNIEGMRNFYPNAENKGKGQIVWGFA